MPVIDLHRARVGARTEANWIWRRLRRATLAASLALGALVAAPAHAQQMVLVSKDSAGVVGNGESRSGMISADSLWVAFASAATNLVPGDGNARWDVFVKNLQTQAIARVSVASDGSERADDSGLDGLDVNHDGQIVVFSSSAALITDDTNTCPLEDDSTGPCPDIYVRDRAANTTTRISVGVGGAQANGRSRRPRISDDGRYVAFSSLATNLVGGDTNAVEDIFLHDRQNGTTTRVSVTSAGAQVDAESFNHEISGNGGSIAFLSTATAFSSEPDPLPCDIQGSPSCPRAFVHDRATGETTAVRATTTTINAPATPTGTVTDLAIDATGRFVALGITRPGEQGRYEASVVLHDRGRREALRTFGPVMLSGGGGAALSGDGHVVMHTGGFFQILVTLTQTSYAVFDRHTGLVEPALQGGAGGAERPWFTDIELSTDGRIGVFTGGDMAPDDLNGVSDVYVFSRDVDNDKVADAWETNWGLNPADSLDGGFDADGDGLTNLQEYQAGSHPRASMTRYFAEGASNAFFSTRLAFLNTSTTAANVVLRFLGSEGVSSSALHSVPAQTRVTFELGAGAGVPANDFSTVVESDQPFVADRTMTWDATGFGAHAETATIAPASHWFLAEGATHGFFDLFYLIQNPNGTDALVTIDYLRPAPLPVISRTYTLAANSRRTIWVDEEDADLASTDVSAEIVGTQPIIVERAMYFSAPGQPAFVAGHDGAGVTAASTTWFLAEGATGDFFDEYLLIANPGATDTTATVSYLLPDGTRFSKPYAVAHQSRLTISVEGEDPRLAGTSVAAIVEAPHPIVVERAMWWPGPLWHEGHLAVGATATGTRWALAEGEIGVNATGGDTETYILIANTSDSAGSAIVTLFHENQAPATSQIVVQLPANGRVTVPVSSSFPSGNFTAPRRFGVIIESTGVPIVVERAMYTTTNGVFWSAGTSALATRLQ